MEHISLFEVGNYHEVMWQMILANERHTVFELKGYFTGELDV